MPTTEVGGDQTMEALTDKQIIHRVRTAWPTARSLAHVADRYGWPYHRLYDTLRRNGALQEFGLGRRRPRRAQSGATR